MTDNFEKKVADTWACDVNAGELGSSTFSPDCLRRCVCIDAIGSSEPFG